MLGDRLPNLAEHDVIELPDLRPSGLDRRTIYRDVLFHGPDLHGITRVEGCDDRGIAILCGTAPPPPRWIEQPLRQAWLTDPLVLDCAFQAMVLWSFEQTGACSLPTAVGRYRQFRRGFPTDQVRIVARITLASERSARADIGFLAADGTLIAKIDDYECVIDASLNQAFRRNELAEVAPR
jgi:hypothetical protein